ncbi:glycoside hydrolase family 127 protein [Paenibacillus arenilitoris]|uniref:Glycoside hydrolase family 127 protein n=1 Tax=Paenibacillus arenilitoris TaxID=2772299 RepID=A0A927H5R0_9BACL|nr:beta-L-arabinofuranosidase domain-containing protein [Paenibacillus arenilitoris]MBD2868803.1 glycoside hydrolase family 127 protein [Paenibacillus arenilitoris]
MENTQTYIRDDFWQDYTELVRQTVIPYQWEALNDRIEGAEPSHAIRNFRIAAGLEEGEFGGWIFQDSDLYKWLEAVAYTLRHYPDPELEKTADGAIDLIGQAQHENGYLNTYFSIKEPGKQWTNLYEAHELYCAGHLIEAAVAYYQSTGKRKLLDMACRFADLIDRLFGEEPGQIRAYCGHQEIELALVKLYKATGEERYLNLSSYFIDERGSKPNYFIGEWERRGRTSIWSQGMPNLEVYQSHLPVRDQTAAVGHSVRAVYMYTAMADLALLTGDDKLREACERLWDNTTRKQMYITGGIGSTHLGEAFTFDYDLPNDTVYAETCASIGLIFWARRMLRIEAKSDYADVMERALYNNVLGSMSRDGKHFFYVNPLEVWPDASSKNPDRFHVKPVRQKWFGCSCCPPNVARLLSSLNDYIYDVSDHGKTVYTHLFIGSELGFETANRKVTLRQRSELPWSGRVEFAISVSDKANAAFELALRIPDWFQKGLPVLKVNGAEHAYRVENGYAKLERDWSDGDTLEWLLPLESKLIAANPLIRANAGKAAIQRGPLVYCVEETDNGAPLASISLAEEPNLTDRFVSDLLGGCIVVEGDGLAADESEWPADKPYQPLGKRSKPVRFKAIPYYLWGNRKPGEMSVWLRY